MIGRDGDDHGSGGGPDIPDMVDPYAVAAILRQLYPEWDPLDLMRRVTELLEQQGNSLTGVGD